MLVAAGVFFALDAVHPLLGLVWNVAALYLLMGFRRFSHAYTGVEAALEGQRPRMRRGARLPPGAAAPPRELSSGEIAKLAIERGLMDSYRQVFATLFWFTVLPGPAGAVLYRAAVLLAEEWRGDAKGADTTPIAQARAVFGGPARGAALAARLDSGAAHGAVVRDRRRFRGRRLLLAHAGEGVGRRRRAASMRASCSRAAPGRWACSSAVRCRRWAASPTSGPSSGLGDEPEADLLPSAVGLVWRALVLWLLLMLLLTLANWAP